MILDKSKVKSIMKRVCSGYLFLILLFGIFPIEVFAELGTITTAGDSDNAPIIEGYKNVGGLTSFAMNKAGVTTAISIDPNNLAAVADSVFSTPGMDSASTIFSNFMQTQTENTTEKGLNEIISYYGRLLVYANWATRNWWTDESGGTKYSIVDLPLGSAGNLSSPVTSEEFANFLDNIDTIQKYLVTHENILPNTTTWITDDIPVYIPADSKLNVIGMGNYKSSFEGLGQGELATYDLYIDTLIMMCQHYMDANILLAIAKGEGMEGYENWSYADLLNNVGNSDSLFWTDTTYSGKYSTSVTGSTQESPGPGEGGVGETPPETSTVATGSTVSSSVGNNLYEKYKDVVSLYLTSFNDIYNLLTTRNQLGFVDYISTTGVGSSEVITTYRAYHRDDNDISNTEDYLLTNMSDTFVLLYKSNSFSNTSAKDPGYVEGGKVSTIDTSNGVFGMLVKDGIINNGKIVVNGDPELTDIGYVVLAAGVTYDPFVSIAGNDGWLATVERFWTKEVQKEEVNRILQLALNTKKPLYVTEGSRSDWTSTDEIPNISAADYRYAYLTDMLQDGDDITRAYAVIKGSMLPSQVDNSTWEYANKSDSSYSSNSSTEVHVDDLNQSGVIVSGSGSSANEKSEESLLTTGSEKVFASTYQMTAPVCITSGAKTKWWGTDSHSYPAAVGGLTTVILHNAALDAKDNKYLQSPQKYQVFMNGLGDIVLSDGTIILPAIVNPCLFNYSAPKSEFGEDFTSSIKSATDFQAYYPYNATFMNHYPAARVNSDGRLIIDTNNDVDKYLMLFNAAQITATWDLTTLYAKKIESIKSGSDEATMAQLNSMRTASFIPNAFRVEDDEETSYSLMSIAKGSGGASLGNYLNWGIILNTSNYDNALERFNMLFITRGRAYNEDGMSFFPLCDDSSETREAFLALSGPITNSALRYISDNDVSTGSKISSGAFRIETYIYDFIGESLLGTQYADSIVKSTQVSYESLVEDQGGRFLQFLIQIVESACDNLGKIDGVLSIKGPYDNPFFNKIFIFIQDFYLIIAVVLLVVTAAKFFKGHFNMLYVCFVGVLCVASFEVYANWLPTLVPQIYNFAVNDSIEDIVWHTTFYNAERYQDTYKNSDNVDPTSGKLQPYTGTITLYQLTNAEMREIATRNSVTEDQLRKGVVVYLDSDAGIFVQGNLIKMSLDKLLVNNSMRGLYKSQWDTVGTEYTGTEELLIENIPAYNGNPYSIQLIQPLVSLESYYTPYDHFERALISQLNQFANYFMIERRMYPYGTNNELYKDAFMVNAYINSGILTAPGDDLVLSQNVNPNTITVDVSNLQDAFVDYDVADLVSAIQSAFYPQDDWLGLVKVFAEPDEGIKNSLWGYLMQRREWYDTNWSMTERGEEKLNDLVRYINTHTKKWVFENVDYLGYMSDENAIKMISLYATTCFTHYLSEPGQWVFPNYINAADIELKDVLYGAMVTLKDKNFIYDGTVIKTVGLNFGVFGVLFILLIIIFSSLFIFVVTYMIPILYGALGLIVVYKLVNVEDKMGLIKGYVKVTAVSAILYFLFSLSLRLVEIGGYRWYSYMMCAVCLFFCNYFLFWVVLSVIQDFGNLGNNTLTNNLTRGFDRITRGMVSNMHANVANIRNSRGVSMIPRTVNQYVREYSVDDYDRPVARRSTLSSRDPDLTAPRRYGEPRGPRGYGRQDYYEDTLGSSRSSRTDYSTKRRRGWRSKR